MGQWHDARLAGRWFSADAAILRDELQAWLDAAAGVVTAEVQGLIVPHAGYMYSGAVAAYAYAALRAYSYARVVVLAPSHYCRFRGAALLDWDGFETPLGRVAIDRASVAALRRQPLFLEYDTAFDGEHSLEIQLPFLRRVLPEAQVVPLLLGDLDADDCSRVAAALAQLDRRDTFFLVSSDLTHYGARFGYLPFPADDDRAVRSRLRDLAFGAIDAVCAGDLDGFRSYVASTGATICGRTPIAVFLELHRRRSAGKLVCYRTSLDVTGDYEHCVSYASIAFSKAPS